MKRITTHFYATVLSLATIACLISCKATANEMTLRFKDSITFIASNDLIFRIYEDSVMTKEFVGKGYTVADSIVYRAKNSDHCIITIHGEVENLVFRKNIDDNYGKGYEYYQKPKTLIVFAETISYFDNDKMTSLRCMVAMGDEMGKRMKNMTVDKNENLEELWCSNVGLEELDVSKNKKLRTLYCANNRLSKLDVTNNKNLENLVCFDNGITSLDVSENRRLKFLSCDNPLKELDITNNEDLEDLICRAELRSLDIRNR